MNPSDPAKPLGNVIHIQRYSLHDGPGIRTVVFLKGCPLRCRWCSNPESWRREREVYLDPGKCIGTADCKGCVEVCPAQAIISTDGGPASINRELCTDCLLCTEVCPSQAAGVYGRMMTVDEVLAVVEQESAFYRRSGGGLTVSGGEATLQGDFTLALLREAKKRRIKTALETCGYGPWETFEALLPFLDHIYYDVKSLNAEKHRAYTGVEPDKIVDNLRRLAGQYDPERIVVRTPVIPGFNDGDEEISAIYNLIKTMRIEKYELLKYHRFGSVKYGFLNKPYLMGDVQLTEERFARLRQAAGLENGANTAT